MNLLLFNLRVDRHHTALGFTTDWINELARHFEHITVITMYKGDVCVAPNVEVFSAGRECGWSKPRRVAAFYRELFNVLRRRRYDCCFAHMMPLFLMLAGPMLRFKRIPAGLWYAHNHKPAILPLATAFADKALVSTRSAFPMETLKLRVVGQGIDTDRFRPEPARSDGKVRLITIGRISPIKNIDLMLRAVARLHAEHRLSTELLVIGEALTGKDQHYAASCRDMADSLGIAGMVHWLPPVPFDRVHEAYHQGDVFLSANDNGLDKAILEAMACGLPVIAMHPAVAEPLRRFYARDEQSFYEALVALCELDSNDRGTLGMGLREYVIREHGLARLGRRIADELKGMTL